MSDSQLKRQPSPSIDSFTLGMNQPAMMMAKPLPITINPAARPRWLFLNQWETSINHCRELTSENNNILISNRAKLLFSKQTLFLFGSNLGNYYTLTLKVSLCLVLGTGCYLALVWLTIRPFTLIYIDSCQLLPFPGRASG